MVVGLTVIISVTVTVTDSIIERTDGRIGDVEPPVLLLTNPRSLISSIA